MVFTPAAGEALKARNSILPGDVMRLNVEAANTRDFRQMIFTCFKGCVHKWLFRYLLGSVFWASLVGCPLNCVAGRSDATENAELPKINFPSPPPALTNLLTIGQPQIKISTNLMAKLQGEGISNLIESSVGNLLNDSERFILTRGKKPELSCLVNVSDLEIKQSVATNKASGGFLGGIGGVFRTPGGSLATNVNWEKSNQAMSIYCIVTLQIWDASNDNLLGDGRGEIKFTNSAKSINMQLPGVNSTSSETGPSSNQIGLEGRLIELASYCALTNSFPKLDKRLLQPRRSAPTAETKTVNKESASTASGFCSNCGAKLEADDKFCPSCGKQVGKGSK